MARRFGLNTPMQRHPGLSALAAVVGPLEARQRTRLTSPAFRLQLTLPFETFLSTTAFTRHRQHLFCERRREFTS